MIVNGGKKWYRDITAGAADWELNSTKRYMGAGTSTDTNAGVTGPTIAVPTLSNGDWQGVANSDFKLTTELTDSTHSVARPECSFSIGSNGVVHVQAIFTDANFFEGDSTNYELKEFGIFLDSDTIPGNSPVDFPTATNKQNAMIARYVNMYLDVNEYKTWTYTKTQNIPLVINFDLIDFGA